MQSEPVKETKATTQPAKVEDMSQPVQSTKIETVVNKPEQSINKVDGRVSPKKRVKRRKADEVQVAQKSLNDVSRNEK